MKKEINERPILITVICILGFIGAPLSVFAAAIGMSAVSLSVNITPFPLWYSIFAVVIAIFYFFALIYIWKMKRIGLIAYAILAALDFAIGFSLGFADITGLIVSAIVIGLLFTQFRKMD